VIEYFHEVYSIKSQLIDLHSAPNEKSGMTANCITQMLKDHGLLTKCIALSGDNMNTDFGGNICSGNKNVFHALKCELKKKLASAAVDVQHTSFTTAYSMEQMHCL
jgi:hypothetical protein